jgi:hypothetical protein
MTIISYSYSIFLVTNIKWGGGGACGCLCVPVCAWVCMGVHGCAWVRGCAWVCMGVHGCVGAWVCMGA